MKTNVIEIVEFKLKEDACPVAFLEEVKNSDKFIKSLDVFLTRTVIEKEHGVWVDMAKWETMDAAQNAAEAFCTTPEVAKLCSLIDLKTTNMKHYSIAHASDNMNA